MSFFESLDCVFHTKFSTLPKPESNPTGGAGDWNKLANRPFGYVEHYDLLAETAVTFSGSDPAIGGLSLSASLTEGKAYPVNFDGTQYLCRYESGKLGNLALEGGADTGEPFLWYVTESMILTTAGTGTHTVSLQGDVPQRVPYEYLPFGFEEEKMILPTATYAVFNMDGMPCAQIPIFDALENGTECRVVFNGVPYTCSCIVDGGVCFIGNASLMGAEDTGEPFLIASMGMMIVLDGSNTVSLSVSVRDIKRIPSSFLPGFPEINLTKAGVPGVPSGDTNRGTQGIPQETFEEIASLADTGFVKFIVSVGIMVMTTYTTIQYIVAPILKAGTSSFLVSACVGSSAVTLHFFDQGEDIPIESRYICAYESRTV